MITDKQFQTRLDALLTFKNNSKYKEFRDELLGNISVLFKEQEYSRVVQLFHNNICNPKDDYYIFEVAFALADKDLYLDEAEIVYENILNIYPKNVASLNNLAIIKETNNQIKEAHDLIKLSHELEPHNELYTRNYKRILPKYEEAIKYDVAYRSSLELLEKETEFAISKLKTFIFNAANDSNYKAGKISIPTWKFGVFMNTDKQKAESLKEQWLRKNYIRNTEERGEHNELIYELNPYLKEKIEKISGRKLNAKWIAGVSTYNQ